MTREREAHLLAYFHSFYQVLRNADVFDSSIVETLVKEMAKHGPAVRPGSDVKEVVKEADGSLTVHLKDGSVHPGFDCILWAIGRHPVTAGLGLEEAGVVLERGFVEVIPDPIIIL